ncbi:MAG: adenosine kinase [Alphaproteobacteria bacterium]
MKYDLLGIGNGLIDCLGKTDDENIAKIGIEKGTMALIETETSAKILDVITDKEIASGGSVANTMAGFSALGGKSGFIGRLGNDDLGELFVKDMNTIGIDYLGKEKSTTPSGNCTIMVSPDGQRTMATCLGASVEIGIDDIDLSLLSNAKVVYLEGYLFDAPSARSCFDIIGETLKGTDTKIAFTLSDMFVVERHREDLLKFVQQSVDILFANEDEINHLMGTNDVKDAIAKASEMADVVIGTCGENGAYAMTNGKTYFRPANKVDVVDTTGAGDQFAGGFLFGYANTYGMEDCLQMGINMASSVITHMGGRLTTDAKELIKGI